MASIDSRPAVINIPTTIPATPGSLSSTSSGGFFSSVRDAYTRFSERREALGLSYPGTVDGISREVQREVFLNNLMFSGLRAELNKAFSASPLFQTAHSFSMGSQAMPPYSFAALYGSPKVFLQGNIDNDLQLSARANYRWNPALVSKTSVQLAPGGPGQAMVTLETDYTGADFSASLKAMNPSLLEGGLTGIFIGSYLQSVTPRLSLGLEGIWQRAGAGQGPDAVMSYAARYKGYDWILSGNILAQGGVQTSFWKRLSDKVEAGVDLNLQLLSLSGGGAGMMMGGPRNEGSATLGAKYEFRSSIFRGQVDSAGKVSCVLEKAISPPVRVTFAGELDHVKNTAKVGLAIQIESGSEEYMEQQEKVSMANVPPPPF